MAGVVEEVALRPWISPAAGMLPRSTRGAASSADLGGRGSCSAARRSGHGGAAVQHVMLYSLADLAGGGAAVRRSWCCVRLMAGTRRSCSAARRAATGGPHRRRELQCGGHYWRGGAALRHVVLRPVDLTDGGSGSAAHRWRGRALTGGGSCSAADLTGGGS
ncbi:hypothetical protein VPH35_064110 [Triticum aestivum]